MKRTFKMNNKTYNSLMDIARELGVKRVYTKDFAKYDITELSDQVPEQVDDTSAEDTSMAPEVVDDTSETETQSEEEITAGEDSELKAEDSEEDAEPETEKVEEPSETEPSSKSKVPKAKKQLGTTEEISDVQSSVDTLTVVEFNERIKHFTVEALETMAENIGVDTWSGINNPPIRKMRLLMEIKSHYYPTDKTPVRPKSNWKKIPLVDLMELAKVHELEFKKSSDNRIQRMWVIAALNKQGLTVDDLNTPSSEENDNE